MMVENILCSNFVCELAKLKPYQRANKYIFAKRLKKILRYTKKKKHIVEIKRLLVTVCVVLHVFRGEHMNFTTYSILIFPCRTRDPNRPNQASYLH